ncbi:uncharacterized protein BO66DRAFT_149507 [Aspergillus aculeatinus CBS 121060]|uniref:Uncharacterized protein n=1 Tax=Aspergillus aculeatinus CBS 121060 TaxID=1448322 RepID=A0ACD1H207_9EURO|nr:hypothetical protein BO66DRAFT_149507 [Aspergillus aculeatinus CBS 121060]RAH67646.1 hypothetical protein BO66DRAFT_149507 [Aspergillus aculeatinus CBS 121060]
MRVSCEPRCVWCVPLSVARDQFWEYESLLGLVSVRRHETKEFRPMRIGPRVLVLTAPQQPFPTAQYSTYCYHGPGRNLTCMRGLRRVVYLLSSHLINCCVLLFLPSEVITWPRQNLSLSRTGY